MRSQIQTLPSRTWFARGCGLFMFVCALLLTSSPAMHAQWTQSWATNFTGAANTTYDHNQWWNEVSPTANWGDGTIMGTSDSLQNAYLDGNGNLVIAMTYTAGATTPYMSARLHSVANIGPYGKIETRIQNPSALGMGAAFWSLGSDAFVPGTHSTAGATPWPWCGELDMMELQAKSNTHNGSTIHGGETDGGTNYEYGGISTSVDLTNGQTFDNSFHVFTTQWAPYHFQYFLDGNMYGDVTLADLGATDIWPMEQPINFILSSGVGGNGGTPNGTGFPSNMVINYVNYSKYSSGAPAAVSGLTAVGNYSNAVNLSWNASSTSGVTYDIYASTIANTATSLGTLVAEGVTGTTYQHTGLKPNTTYYYTVVSANWGGESSASTASATTQAAGNSTGIQLSAGGYGVGTYMPSNFVLGGSTNFHLHNNVDTSLVTNPAPQKVYDTERWGAAAWTISGLNPRGGYNVRLHFVESAHAGAGMRNFGVSINSAQVLTNFDIYAAAGAMNKAVVEQFYTQADENGIIELQTLMGTSTVADLNPTISAIEILPATGSNPVGAAPGNTTTLSINSGGAAVSPFVADEMFNGGDTATSTATMNTAGVANAAPAAVYQTQRYVPFTYVLTGLQADATYTVRMHFAETYWTAAGQRLFNVVLNGNQVLTKFDIFATAGAQDKAVVQQFTTTADMYGQIIAQFIYAGADQPSISGIEVIQTAAAVGAPSNLAATGGSGSVSLSWNASSTGGATYSIYRGVSGSNPTVLVSGVNGTTYNDTNVTNGTTYVYYVVATSGSGTSPASNSASATPNGSTCNTAPGTPGTPAATAASSSQINLTWAASSSSCTSITYNVFRSTSAGFTPGTGNQIAAGLSSTSYSDNGLAASMTYYYAVEAINAGGTSAASSEGSATTQPSGGGGSDVIAINAGGAATGTFSADEDYTGGGTYSTGATIDTSAANAAPAAVYQSEREGSYTYTLPGLTAGTTYTVRLHFAELYFNAAGQRVFNVSINGTPVLTNFDIVATAGSNNKAVVEQFTATANSSGQIVITTSNGTVNQPAMNGIEVIGSGSVPTVPNAPTGLGATAVSASQINLSWTASSTSGVTYKVFQSTTSGFAASSATQVASGLTGTTYAATGLNSNTPYYFLVEATNTVGNSNPTAQATATTQPGNNGGADIFAINSGGGVTGTFTADEDFIGGGTYSVTNTINTSATNAAPAAVYQSARQGSFTYTLPGLVAGSTHTVRLHFAELYFSAAGQRVFNVAINGTTVLANFDIVKTAGSNYKAVVETFTATANNSGQIVITTTNGTIDQPMMNGIEVQ